MKKVTLIKECYYRPNGSRSKVFGRPGVVRAVSTKDAEDMIKGNVAELFEPEPVKAPRNRKKSVKKTK